MKSGLTPADLEFFERELDSFVPRDIFDAHVHLYDTAHLGGGGKPPVEEVPESSVGLDVFQQRIEHLIPKRRTGG